MIESVTREILLEMKEERERQNRPKVLFIFCDSTAHEPFIDQLIELNNHGINHDILFLDGETSAWLGMHRIECGGAGKIIALDEYAPAPLEVPKEYAGIVIPEIDLDNAARVVSGMKGTIKAEIIFSALVLQKFVLVGEDIPGIKRSDRRTLKAPTLPLPYQKLFQRQVGEMKELGVEFQPEKELARAVIQKLAAANQAEQSAESELASEESSQFKGKLLTADWVKSQTGFPDKTVLLKRGVIVSPLAQDLLRERGIRIQFTGKG